MNKTHWNTVRVDGDLEDALVKQLIDMSYQLVMKSLPKRERAGLSI